MSRYHFHISFYREYVKHGNQNSKDENLDSLAKQLLLDTEQQNKVAGKSESDEIDLIDFDSEEEESYDKDLIDLEDWTPEMQEIEKDNHHLLVDFQIDSDKPLKGVFQEIENLFAGGWL